MEKKGINRMFLSIIMIHIIVIVILMMTPATANMGIFTNLLLSESMIMVPGFVFLLVYTFKKENFCERMHFKKIKISTVFMLILFTFMIMPLTTLLNAVSMLFVDNTVLSMSTQVLSKPFLLMLFMMAVFGPFCEEFVFRGIVYGGYRKEGSIFAAVIVSGLLFGLMHMNFNQAGYAFVIGIVFALLVEATGSIFSSILCHFIFNAQSVCLMYLMNHFMPGIYDAQSSLSGYTKDELYITISVYLVFATITTAVALCILAWIAKNEGRTEYLKRALPSRERKGSNLCSISLVIGIVVVIAYMIFEVILTKYLS